MERINDYRNCIEKIILDYDKYKSGYSTIHNEVLFDRERDHYQLMRIGWHEDERLAGCILHFDIKDGKIWIQHDGTEHGIANDLLEMGVPKSDIVLAYHAPYKRKYTGFAEG